MTALDTLTIITALDACDDAREWAADYPDPQTAWSACPRGEWLAWWLGRIGEEAGDGSAAHRRAVLVACLCARTAPRLPDPSLHALDLIEAWAWGGEDRREEAKRVAYTAAYAYTAAAAYAAANANAYANAYAAYAAADAAAYAADAAAYAADAAAYAANAAAYAAYAAANAYAAWHNARRDHLAAAADLIRAAVPVVPLPGGE